MSMFSKLKEKASAMTQDINMEDAKNKLSGIKDSVLGISDKFNNLLGKMSVAPKTDGREYNIHIKGLSPEQTTGDNFNILMKEQKVSMIDEFHLEDGILYYRNQKGEEIKGPYKDMRFFYWHGEPKAYTDKTYYASFFKSEADYVSDYLLIFYDGKMMRLCDWWDVAPRESYMELFSIFKSCQPAVVSMLLKGNEFAKLFKG